MLQGQYPISLYKDACANYFNWIVIIVLALMVIYLVLLWKYIKRENKKKCRIAKEKGTRCKSSWAKKDCNEKNS